jgi:hypothetical protein
MRSKPYFFFAALILCWFSTVSHAAELRGIVRTRSGGPLAGVSVSSVDQSLQETRTDKDGRFTLANHGRIILFRNKGYRPLTKTLDPDAVNIEIVLEESHSEIPPCAADLKSKRLVGFLLRYAVPENLELKKVTDADYQLFILYHKKNKAEWLELWFGNLVSDGKLPVDLLLSSDDYWLGDFSFGLDIHGVSRDQQAWRKTSSLLNLAVYKNASSDSAKIFDKVIDGVCIDQTVIDKK